jgi:cyclopropane-fatty-acyl-phospholipid synthase
VRAIEQAASVASLRVTAERALGAHYARTLRLWRDRFCRQESEIDALEFDAVFRRMWNLYLAYSEAGFQSGYLNLHQFALEHAP